MDVLKELSSFLKISSVTTDDWVFRLHYHFTTALQICFSIVVVSDQFFGDAINCMTTIPYEDGVPEDVINNFCWIHSTYTLPKAYDIPVGEQVAHPGMDQRLPEDDVVYHAYYQWVCLFLFLQAIMFYVPRYLWNQTDVDKILADHDPERDPGKDQDPEPDPAGSLAKKVLNGRGTYRWQTFVYVFCEVLNLANVLGQIAFTNRFLGGEFTTYGTEVITFASTNQANRTDPMIKIFPRVTKCTFRQHGPGGSIQNHDTLCVLPINVINEKIFIFLWFWYLILACITSCKLLFTVLVLVSESMRASLLNWGLPRRTKDVVATVVGDCTIGDWFILSLWKKNLMPTEFVKLITDYNKLKTDKKIN